MKRELREIGTLKQSAISVTRLAKEIERAGQEITNIENELTVTGSTKTLEEVEQELSSLSDGM